MARARSSSRSCTTTITCTYGWTSGRWPARLGGAETDQAVARLQRGDVVVVEAEDVLAAHDGHDRLRDGQCSELHPGLRLADLALDEVDPGADRQQVLEHLDGLRAVHGLAEQAPGGGRGQDPGGRAGLLA